MGDLMKGLMKKILGEPKFVATSHDRQRQITRNLIREIAGGDDEDVEKARDAFGDTVTLYRNSQARPFIKKTRSLHH